MPAHKLTPGRLAQLILMLAILIAAFTWRTLNYVANEPTHLCVLHDDKCSLTLGQKQIYVHQHSNLNLHVSRPSQRWQLASPENNVVDNDNGWQIKLKPAQQKEVLLQLTDEGQQTYKVIVEF